uniref:Neprilysin 5, isoform D n=2 Tax=Drosophila melanogaster TaxID=7227 RepID=Q8IMQ2_DROME|nr:neprilysin 5, isoform D [Drosophila melanogaster]AAN14386.2 neprilysin 5, isoform D [Drosophila melanogaster]|eukprot:NP_733186.2 neprilysin 5, isoform D [Drosophila melanogaster]
MTMEDRNRIWTTGNINHGFFGDNLQQQPLPLQRLQTPGNLSLLSAPIRANGSGNGNATANGHGQNSATESANGKQLPYEPISPNLIGIQSKFRRSYYHKVVLGGLLALVIILLIAIIVISLGLKKSSSICRSKECLRTAASLIYAMDEQTDPCEDFYQFTCGRWANEHPRPDSVTSNDWFRERQAHIMRVVREFLRSNITKSEPEAVGKAKTMYRACMDTKLLDKRDLEPLINYLLRFGLPVLPSALNLTLGSGSKYATEAANVKYNWLQSIVSIKQHLTMDLIIGFDVFPDPFNRTINRIALGTPETDSAFPFNNDDSHKMLRKIHRKTIFMQNSDDEDDSEDDRESEEEEAAKQTSTGMTAYLHYVRKVIEKYLLYVDPNVNQEEATLGITELVKQGVRVARKVHEFKEEAENMTKPSKNPADDIVYITLQDLQNQTDKNIAPKTLPIWVRYMELILKGTRHAGNIQMTQNLTIITSQADITYLQNIVEYLDDTPASHIESYLFLSTIEELVLHTSSSMRLLHSEYMRVAIGTEGSTPRSLYCANGVNSLLGMAVSYVLADADFTKEKLPKVERMLSDIRRSFDRLVKSTSWMDAATKRKTIQKSAEMKSFIGFPPWLRNASVLNAYYEGAEVNASTHLENLMDFVHWQMMDKLNEMDKPEPIGWATSPSNVNAFHTFQSNAITVPIAILQYPFYDLGLEALNYGSIGTILGHELTHGFDDSGRRFDRAGNMVEWWSNRTIDEYVNRTECFVEQYSRYHLADIDEYIDGELTLGENIADNGGMREAFYAYRLYVKEVGRERSKLPGLEHYSHEQLFFISFGNLWCETYTPAASRYALTDSHCPGQMRLRGVLSNSEEFARTFKCARGTPMNPDQPKCRIW